MLSDEEKEAIEYFKSNLEMTKEMGKKWGFQEEIKNNETILNLIEKQSKEIEELKNGQIDFWISDKEIEERIRNKFVSKDKIKAKIEEYENKIKKIRSKKIINEPEDTIIITRYAHYISVLKSLLEKE